MNHTNIKELRLHNKNYNNNRNSNTPITRWWQTIILGLSFWRRFI